MSNSLQSAEMFLNDASKCTHHTKEAQCQLAQVALEEQTSALTTPRTKAGTQKCCSSSRHGPVRPSIHAGSVEFPCHIKPRWGQEADTLIKEQSRTLQCPPSGFSAGARGGGGEVKQSC